MKISILDEKNNPLLKRREMIVEIEHDGAATPSKAALQAFLSKSIRTEPEKIEILDIFSGHGISKSKANMLLWEEKKVDDLSKVKKEKSK